MSDAPRPSLTGERVALRPPTLDDVPAITAACQDAEIRRWTTVPTPYSEEHAREFVEYAERSWESDRSAALVVIDGRRDELLGAIELSRAPHDRSVGEIGYWVRAEARGKGVAAQAARLLARWGFDAFGLARVSLLTEVENLPSQRAAERAGFRREGVLRSYMALRGERRDWVMFGLVASDLEARPAGSGE